MLNKCEKLQIIPWIPTKDEVCSDQYKKCITSMGSLLQNKWMRITVSVVMAKEKKLWAVLSDIRPTKHPKAQGHGNGRHRECLEPMDGEVQQVNGPEKKIPIAGAVYY